MFLSSALPTDFCGGFLVWQFCYFRLDITFRWGYEKACQRTESMELTPIPEAIAVGLY